MADQEDTNTWGSTSWTRLSSLRQQSPLIQCITNLVSMDIMANTLLAAGASPAMVHSILEIPEFTPHTQAVVINVGTLTPDWLPAMKAAAAVANQLGKPWVLDPAAVGASGFRLKACLELIELKPTVVRGNGSEIIALSMASLGSTKGADSLHESSDAVEAAKSLAKSSGSIVAISGSVDFVTDGQRVIGAHNGVPMLQKITATGCAVTALIAAFVATDQTHAFEATASALSVFGLAGEIGMGLAKGPASLRMHLIDSLHGLDQETVLQRVKITSFS
ncbi:putative hydroxyethylthiazole kinase [Helianthus annuus]|uniref:Hydroxyethylthiazole kinase n=1 Tax=Helianthus annuus TaxID=4232 RepID=A0A251VRS2_HELAN|nr:hydroxyethylthiazole kinase [Helianthus annuus]KAF5823077.1 putative hydroxyethylthiazole kinase [Helianthus annuus]KAJ0623952.1 putative hydroxyethylthiazole kinase [Helianthus annuus]KAJ0627832.1 putative hydroxyethylthiazole kinase [Helianthus annuus]KAJ0784113.1 putative hydroxyethylthiazole kinase [Helianthus annuus]KAJ0949118.1 putative hydroxyethylthiazole kinase [Helianthus annuus]